MIVVSLLLILVAVTLLVLGLTGGSSVLLIASIAASLLAAIALVIGARSTAAARRAAAPAPEPASDFSTSGRSSAPPSHQGPPRSHDGPPPSHDGPPPSHDGPPPSHDGPPPSHEGPPARSEYAAEPEPSGYPETSSAPNRQNDPGTMMDDPPAPDEGLASSGSLRARVASAEDAEAALRADAAYRDGSPDPDPPAFSPSGYHDAVLTDDAEYERERAARAGDGDYHQASSYIGGARSDTAGEDAWRRPAAESPAEPPDEFDEPDADDPDDEPLPQAVRPADAVRVAQMDDEVLVVDGRPRYHMADCAHLVGKLTEGLPVSEAVELGFSPCGLCRPVDRLVAQAAHR